MTTHIGNSLRIAAAAALILTTASTSAQEAAATAAPAPGGAPAAAAVVPVAAPAPAPAAKSPGVTVYGTLNANFQITQAKGATNPAESVSARNAVSIDSSNVGVKAQAEVVGGLTVIGQCETSASIDGIDVKGICNRNSRVGVQSQYGTLFYGNWDTPFKAAAYGTKADDPFQNTDAFGYQAILGSPGFNYRSGGWSTSSTATVGGFDVRANNSVAYHSPKVYGVSVKLQYSASENADAKGSSIPQLVSGGVNYEWEGLSLLAAYERHYDSYGLAVVAGNPTTHNTVDSAWRVGAGYQLDTPAGATTFGVLVDQLVFTQDNAAVGDVKEAKRLAWQVSAKHRLGDHELRARYDSAGEADGELQGGGSGDAPDTGATQITVGYAYHLAKAAHAYVSYTRIFNERNAQYTLPIGGSPAVAGKTPAGAEPQALGLGIRYSF
ncbi:MAG: porin [Anaeromyxobacteraceae bacterium]